MSGPRRRILGITGSRAEFGLLAPVFAALERRPEIELLVAVAGAHLLPPARTRDEVAARFPVAAEIVMQRDGETGRLADAAAAARGMDGVTRILEALRPDGVVVLGDRIEAFAAAAAAAIAGVHVAHLHGGDRAEGIADEGMRHAVSKLAHLHLAATEASAERLRRMGEDAARVHVVGSPALDGLESIPPLDEARYVVLGRPEIVVLLHPAGGNDDEERSAAAALLAACAAHGRTLALHPNFDPGRAGILAAIAASGVRHEAHLPRAVFIGLLRRARLLAGNSSAGLIEAAALRVPALNVGSRQAGRERGANVVDEPSRDRAAVERAVGLALAGPKPPAAHPFGDGRAGPRSADLLASDAFLKAGIAKRNSY